MIEKSTPIDLNATAYSNSTSIDLLDENANNTSIVQKFRGIEEDIMLSI